MKGFKFAFKGLKTAFSSEINLKTHFIFTVFVCLAGWYFKISTTEWLVVALNIGMVISLELVNTAIEYLVDLVSPDIHPVAGKIKDVSAAAVLIAAATAFISGIIIFLPKLYLQFFS